MRGGHFRLVNEREKEREREKNRGRHGFAVVDDADQRAIVDDRFVQELHPIGDDD